jgi:hypothetical protein
LATTYEDDDTDLTETPLSVELDVLVGGLASLLVLLLRVLAKTLERRQRGRKKPMSS